MVYNTGPSSGKAFKLLRNLRKNCVNSNYNNIVKITQTVTNTDTLTWVNAFLRNLRKYLRKFLKSKLYVIFGKN
jgi:hypothetical protein